MISSFAFAARNLGRRRVRAVLGALGIFVALSLFTAIQTGLDSLALSYLALVEAQTGKADVVVSRTGSELVNAQSFSRNEVPEDFSGRFGLTAFSPRVQGIAVAQHSSGEHYGVLVGADFSRERELGFPSLPEKQVEPGNKQCVLSEALAKKLNAKVGSKVWVRGVQHYSDVELEVVAVNSRQFLLPQQFKDYVLMNLATGQSALGEENRVHSLVAAFRERKNVYDARNLHGTALRLKKMGGEMATGVPPEFQVRMPKAAAITGFQEAAAPLRAFFGVFLLLTLFVTGLLIYSLMAVAVEERIREYGILRTLGAQKSLIFRLVLSESLLLCLLGALPGVVAGIGVSKALVFLIGLAVGGQGGVISLDVRPGTLALTFGAGVMLAVGSAILPGISATRWRIVDALDPLRKGQLPPEPSSASTERPIFLAGLVLSALAGIIFFVLPAALFSGSPSIIGSIVLCLLLALLLGFTMAAMGMLRFVVRVVLSLTGWSFGPVKDLVTGNLDRHRRRHTTTALLFTLSVALVLFLASLVALFARSFLVWVDHSLGADVRVFSPMADAQSMKAELLGIPGVRAASEARFLQSRTPEGIAYDVVISDLVGMKDLWVVPFGVDAELGRTLRSELVQFETGPSDALEKLCAYKPDAAQTNQLAPVILSLAVARFLELSAGDPVELSFRLGSERKNGKFRVLAVARSLPGFKNFRGRVALAVGSGLLLPESVYRDMTAAAPPNAFHTAYFLKTSGETSVQKDVARKLRDDFDLRFRFGVECAAEQKENARAMYWATQVFFGVLLTAAVTIAVFALIASMAVTVLERQREIGVLRALGLRRADLFRLLYGEAVTLTLAAGATGGIIGFVLAWLFVIQAAALVELPVTFTMPYLTFLATIGISLVSGLIAAYIPARSLLKRTTAEILRG